MKRTILSLIVFIIAKASISQNVCPPNIGFELGDFTNWQCYTGTVATTGVGAPPTCGGTHTITVTPSAPVSLRHTIIPPNSLTDPFGGFPTTPDGNAVARLGMQGQTGAQAERLSYTFTVPATSTNFNLTIKAALVFQAPDHCPLMNPYYSAKVFDVTTNQYINCVSGEIFGKMNDSTFQQSPTLSMGSFVYYRPWTSTNLMLAEYAGHSLRLEFTNADCSTGGHWAYCYIDVAPGCNNPFSGNEFCPAPTNTVYAPAGYQSYSWWNSNFTQAFGTSQGLFLNPPPTTPTVYAVDLIPFTGIGCRDTLMVTVAPKPTNVSANAGPDVALCNIPNATLGTPAITGNVYSWVPTNGLSNANIAQPVAQPTANTTYHLTVTDTISGCTKVDDVTVMVGGVTDSFTVQPSTQCLSGNLFSFTRVNAIAGSNYFWDFGDGTTSMTQNPSHAYTTTGTFTIKSKTTVAGGCQDSSTKQVIVVSSIPAPILSMNGNFIVASVAPFATGFRWYLNGNLIPGANSFQYQPVASGVYTCELSLSNCSTLSSNSITYTITGIDAVVAEWKLKIAPNPVNDRLMISYSGNHKLNIEILDVSGRKLFSQQAIPTIYSIDFSKFLNGNYLVRLIDSKTNQEVKKMVTKL